MLAYPPFRQVRDPNLGKGLGETRPVSDYCIAVEFSTCVPELITAQPPLSAKKTLSLRRLLPHTSSVTLNLK